MIYWTYKKSDVTIRHRAYQIEKETDHHVLLDREVLAEVYVFLHKENHGGCIGMIKGQSIRHFMSKEEAFEELSKELELGLLFVKN